MKLQNNSKMTTTAELPTQSAETKTKTENRGRRPIRPIQCPTCGKYESRHYVKRQSERPKEESQVVRDKARKAYRAKKGLPLEGPLPRPPSKEEKSQKPKKLTKNDLLEKLKQLEAQLEASTARTIAQDAQERNPS